MKILILLTLGLALCSAVPQGSDARPRMRGPRRFPLATPGLQSVNRAAAAASIAEEPAEEVAPTRGASRGTSLPRRGRPTLRPRASIQVEEVETVPSTTRTESGRSGLQLRRPRTRVTTTTTSAPPPPVDETPEAPEEMQKEEPIVMDEKMQKPMPEETKMMEQIEETIPVAEMEKTEEVPEPMAKETPTTEAPKPKLRPIPIKLGRRGQGAQPAQQLTDSEPESTKSDAQPQRHRFAVASETGGSLRVRSRGSPANQAAAPVEETSSSVAQSGPRVRRPTPPKQSARVSSRRTPPAEETNVQEQEVTDTEQSLPQLNEVHENLQNDKQVLTELVSSTTTNAPKVDSPHTTTLRMEESLTLDELEPFTSQLESLLSEGPESELPLSFTEDADVLYKESEGMSPLDTKVVEPKLKIKVTKLPPIEVVIPKLKNEASSSIVIIPTLNHHELPQSPTVEVEEYRPTSQRQTSEINPRRSKNNLRGSDVTFRGGEPIVTLIGTLEDTPADEVRVILSGLGSRRRGLGRPLTSSRSVASSTSRTTTKKLPPPPIGEEDLNYDYYADLYEEEPIRKL